MRRPIECASDRIKRRSADLRIGFTSIEIKNSRAVKIETRYDSHLVLQDGNAVFRFSRVRCIHIDIQTDNESGYMACHPLIQSLFTRGKAF